MRIEAGFSMPEPIVDESHRISDSAANAGIHPNQELPMVDQLPTELPMVESDAVTETAVDVIKEINERVLTERANALAATYQEPTTRHLQAKRVPPKDPEPINGDPNSFANRHLSAMNGEETNPWLEVKTSSKLKNPPLSVPEIGYKIPEHDIQKLHRNLTRLNGAPPSNGGEPQDSNGGPKTSI